MLVFQWILLMILSVISKKKQGTIIPSWLFEEKKKAFTIQLSYLHANEKWFIKEIEDFTNSRVKLVKICNTPKIQFLFN